MERSDLLQAASCNNRHTYVNGQRSLSGCSTVLVTKDIANKALSSSSLFPELMGVTELKHNDASDQWPGKRRHRASDRQMHSGEWLESISAHLSGHYEEAGRRWEHVSRSVWGALLWVAINK